MERYSCSICLDLLKDPVTILCGHSYCMSCIKAHWDQETQRFLPSCPQCRQTFTARPVLVKNIMLADLVDEMKKTWLKPTAAAADDDDDRCYADAEDVVCDVCSGRKMRAVKFCLQCLVSYCDKHLQPHFESAAFRKHSLAEVSKKLQENVCSQHHEVMKIFCRTDQHCICYLCSMDEHKGHDMVSTAAERTVRQKELEASQQKIQQRIQDRETDVMVLQQEVKGISRSADEAVEHSDEALTELIRLVEQMKSDVRQRIRSLQETEVSRVEELQKQLEKELTELRRKDAELEKLSRTQDHNQFLCNHPSVSKLRETLNQPCIDMFELHYFEDVTATVSKVKYKLKQSLSEEWSNISTALDNVNVFMSRPAPEPKTRAEFSTYSHEITLDPNTVHSLLSLSDKNRRATAMNERQKYSDHPDRFNYWIQALSRESLPGRCYWEVEWSGDTIYVAATYKDIQRKGESEQCRLGFNSKSWILRCTKSSYEFYHNGVKSLVSGPISSRIGVYLDHMAGVLSFYSVSETMTVLHRVQAMFTQPLYAGLWLISSGTTAKFY